MIHSVVELATVASAFGVWAAAFIMYWEARKARAHNNEQMKHQIDLENKRKDMDKIHNNMKLIGMFNDFNQFVIEMDSDKIGHLARCNHQSSDPLFVKRMYVQFCRLNFLEMAWFLQKTNSLPPEVAESIIEASARNLRSDPDATKQALENGGGYAESFLNDVWPLIFPNEPPPWGTESTQKAA